MNHTAVLYPMFVLVLLTLSVGIALYLLRRGAVRRGEIGLAYFLLNRGGRLPEYLVRVDQHYTNLFELPVLFYALVLILYVGGEVDWYQVWFLWGFVLSRIAHTLIHVTLNRLRWRMVAFLIGFAFLAAGWAALGLDLITGSTGG